MKWVHIDFFFKYLSKDERFLFEDLVRKIIKQTRWIVRRKFYLYEPQPNCFLALELRSIIFLPMLYFICWLYRGKFYFINYMGVHKPAGKDQNDTENGEGFLNIINAFTEWYLFSQYDNRVGVNHIIHCCIEFQFGNKEAEFYRLMAKGYDRGTEKSDTDKKK